jgi:O-succinylbenzoate synthase
MGRKPEQIFIEFAREEGEKVETKKQGFYFTVYDGSLVVRSCAV